MDIVTIKTTAYTIPAELIETYEGGRALVRFAAGNVRFVGLDSVLPATEEDRREFEGATRKFGGGHTTNEHHSHRAAPCKSRNRMGEQH